MATKVKVQDNGKAPSGLSAGTEVVTAGGTYRIDKVNADGSYQSTKVSDENTSTYKGSYDSPGSRNGATTPGYSGGSSGGGGGSSRNASPTVRNAVGAVNAATGVTAGYRPTGTYNDAGLRAAGGGAVDPITQYKIAYEAAKARGDQTGMEQAHNAAQQYRAQFGYSGGDDGSENIAVPVSGLGGMGGGMGGGAVPVASWDGSMAVSADGEGYNIGSFLGKNFIFNGEVGETMTGGDGSKWTKGPDGMVYIEKGGKTYTVQGTPNEPIPEFSMPEFSMPEMYTTQPFDFTKFEDTALGQQARKDYEKLQKQLTNFKAFSYDKDTDPLYQEYADSYTRSGQRAMNDVLGQLAARTGGMASSYAGSMAQQTYDQYMAELANKVPELRNLAYSMYMDDYNKLADQYNRSYQRYADDYNRYMQGVQTDQSSWATANQLNQSSWATMANLSAEQQQFAAQMAYNAYRDKVADRQYNTQNMQDVIRTDMDYKNSDRSYDYQKAQDQRAWDYQMEQDQWNRQMAERELADSQRNDFYSRISNGYMPTAEDAARYGISQTELAALQQWVNNQWGAQSDKWWVY